MLLSNDEIVALADQGEEAQTEALRRRPGGNTTVSSARLHLQGRLNMTRRQALITPDSRSVDSDPLQIRIQRPRLPAPRSRFMIMASGLAKSSIPLILFGLPLAVRIPSSQSENEMTATERAPAPLSTVYLSIRKLAR